MKQHAVVSILEMLFDIQNPCVVKFGALESGYVHSRKAMDVRCTTGFTFRDEMTTIQNLRGQRLRGDSQSANIFLLNVKAIYPAGC